MEHSFSWQGKKVAFLGDSITDKIHCGTTKNYWQFLAEYAGIEPLVYGLNGQAWRHVVPQAEKLYAEHGDDVDAIFVFLGTNDYNNAVPVGNFWSITEEKINSHGVVMTKRRRTPILDESTFCGRINLGLKFLKERFPRQQIVVLTPIHRGKFLGESSNIQVPESCPNDIDVYFEEYIAKIREAADIWSVPLIDLYRTSGLLPELEIFGQYVHDESVDRLHPNAAGHERIAKTIFSQMLTLPPTFR